MDELTMFADWWLQNRPLRPPIDFYSRVGGNTGTVVFRHQQLQVQLFLNDPNSEIVDHTHPNVDSFEVYIAGDVYFRHNGNALLTPEIIAAMTPERLLGTKLRILPNDVHGATVGPSGGSFISIQHWLNGVLPSSVHLDWDGPPLDAGHQAALGVRCAEISEMATVLAPAFAGVKRRLKKA